MLGSGCDFSLKEIVSYFANSFWWKIQTLVMGSPFMKVHPKEGIMCKLIDIKDPKTFRGRVKYFIKAIADLESDVVSYSFNFCFVFLYIYLYFFFFLDSVQQ